MGRVDAFNKGRQTKDDEFYTTYNDIQNELNHYEHDFAGKTVLSNCDDPYESNFCKFFLKNFNYLKLKRYICTSFNASQVIGREMPLLDCDNKPVVKGYGYVIDVNNVPMENGRGISDKDIYNLLHSEERGVKRLAGDGSFLSNECIDYMIQADIICTNPPFSKFIDFMQLLIKYDKKFLIIGRETSISYKEVFPLFQDNKVWLGYTHAKEFIKPDGTIKKFGNVLWFTNLDTTKRHEKKVLYKHYDPQFYPTYDNFNGIDVENTSEIPYDYLGNMGVPINFMTEFNPDQFELVGYGKGELGKSIGVGKNYRGRSDLACTKDGKNICPFSRVIIRKKDEN